MMMSEKTYRLPHAVKEGATISRECSHPIKTLFGGGVPIEGNTTLNAGQWYRVRIENGVGRLEEVDPPTPDKPEGVS